MPCVAALVTACAPSMPAAPSRGGGMLAQPGQVLMVAAARRAEIRQDARLRSFCAAPDQHWRSFQPPEPVAPTEEHATDTRLNPFAWAMMRGGAAAFGDDDVDARSAVIKSLDRWARSDALTALEERTAATIYGVNRLLLPTIVTWSLVRDAPEATPALRRRVEAWLARLVQRSVAFQDAVRPTDRIARNNHLYLSASVAMAFGALTGDDALFARGPAAYRMALTDLRPDGSLESETSRGGRALWYQRHAIASLVAIAEMGRVQGLDLYGETRSGVGLHDAVRFLLDAIEEPSRVAGYARENINPGPSRDWEKQDLGFLEQRGHGRHYMAWAEAYHARFPDRSESARLRRLLAQAPRPLIDEYSGGDISCLSGAVGQLVAALSESKWPGQARP